MKVLIIDDDEDLRNILAHFLEQEWPDLKVEQFDPLERGMPDASFPLGAYGGFWTRTGMRASATRTR